MTEANGPGRHPDAGPPVGWAPPTGPAVSTAPPTTPPAAQPTAAPTAALPFPAAVEDPGDRIDVEASPDAWLSPRSLLVLTVVIAVLLLAAVIGGLVYWITPPLHAIDVPSVPRV